MESPEWKFAVKAERRSLEHQRTVGESKLTAMKQPNTRTKNEKVPPEESRKTGRTVVT
jgi:hypothetical protein